MAPRGEKLIEEWFPGLIDCAHRGVFGNAVAVQNNQYVAFPVIHRVVYLLFIPCNP